MKRLRLHAWLPTLALGIALLTSACSDDGSSEDTGGAAGSGGSSSGGAYGTGGKDATGGADLGGGGQGGETASLPPAHSPAQLTNESAENYTHNRWGLIDAATLATYATNWATADSAGTNAAPNGRPAHLSATARLVVLQLTPANRGSAESTEDYVPSTPASRVYVYELSAFRFNETRDTGLVSASARYQASGETTDAWLADYGIDLSRDFVVFAAGGTSANGAFFQDLGRAVYWLQYWGADLNHLAIVNGTLAQNYTSTLVPGKVETGSLSNDGFSVKELRQDNTSLTVPLEDFQSIVDDELAASDVIEGFDKQFIIDARPTPQFTRTATGSFNGTHPGQFITTAWDSTGAPSNDATGQAKTYVLQEGHVKGAVSFPWAALTEDVGGGNWKYKSKTALVTLFSNAGYTPEDAEDTVIVSQCRTNFEVQVNGFAARVILGYPTVHYDGSLVEYFSLVSGHPTASFNLLPADPAYKYRTDIATRSQRYTAAVSDGEPPTTTENDGGVAPYNLPSATSGPTDRKVSQVTINRNATTTRLALDADREYKRLAD
ncbi:MAG TPA: hypothetical protein VLC09_19830 [Polyangiaceae bacterium]|nr:hypothetical protein [Polyangiaceae bacterium]